MIPLLSTSDADLLSGPAAQDVGPYRHATRLRPRHGVAVTGVPVVGVIPRLPEVVVPRRHLGLIPVAERQPAALEAVAALSLMARKYLDLRQRRGRIGDLT